MERAEYVLRAAKVYMQEGGLNEETAKEAAEACYEESDPTEPQPENDAREDMSYWTNDE